MARTSHLRTLRKRVSARGIDLVAHKIRGVRTEAFKSRRGYILVFVCAHRAFITVLEGDDCDLHLEMSDIGKGDQARRIIAEKPKELQATREALIDRFPSETRTRLSTAKPNGKGNYRAIRLPRPLVVMPSSSSAMPFTTLVTSRFTGEVTKGGRCGFTPMEVQERGTNHGTCVAGTLWEGHPVWKVEK